jgi:hypothetical protein
MGYSHDYMRSAQTKERPWKVHPIWRGIGCVFMLVIPVMAYAGSVLLVEANLTRNWVPAPAVFLQTVLVPLLGKPVDHLYANLTVGFILMLLGYAGLMILYTLMYSLVGPSRLGPLDAPPERRKRAKKYKRSR